MPHSEGLQLSRDLGATYLELPSLNHVFVGRYFGSVVRGHVPQESNGRNKPDYLLDTVVELSLNVYLYISDVLREFFDPASP